MSTKSQCGSNRRRFVIRDCLLCCNLLLVSRVSVIKHVGQARSDCALSLGSAKPQTCGCSCCEKKESQVKSLTQASTNCDLAVCPRSVGRQPHEACALIGTAGFGTRLVSRTDIHDILEMDSVIHEFTAQEDSQARNTNL